MTDKLTQADLTELFGDHIPMDVVILLDRWSGNRDDLLDIIESRAMLWNDELTDNKVLRDSNMRLRLELNKLKGATDAFHASLRGAMP